MTEVLAAVQAAIGLLTQVLGLVLGISGLVQRSAQEDHPFAIETIVANAETALINPTYGLAALQTQLTAFQTDVDAKFASFLQTYGSTSPGTHQVTLPQAPPPGYASESGGGLAYDVWHFQDAGWTARAGDAIDTLLQQQIVTESWVPVFPQIETTSWLVGGETTDQLYVPRVGRDIPDINFGTILPSDASILAWLNRVYPGFAYTANPDGSVVVNPGFPMLLAVTNLNNAGFKILQAAGGGGSSALVPPIWPGVSRATLGTSLAISDGLVIPGPLHGVIIAITAVPTPVGYYGFGSHKSFVRVGAITFFDDHGDWQFPEPIGPDSQVVCPTVMAVADHAVLRALSGLAGTVTPWSIT